MDIKKTYCGLYLVEIGKAYACIDIYTTEIKCKGNYEKCNAYFTQYVDKICNK